ncbi:MAG TPA: hypothetical protein VIT00_06005 [Terrimicrobiaceae bacterium]
MSARTRGLARCAEVVETPQMRFVLLLVIASCSICLAQQSSDKERAGRMFFPPEIKQPAASSKHEQSSASSKQAPGPRRGNSPSEAMEMFFLALKAGQVDSAYDALVKESIIAERREDVSNLKERTKRALDNYGPVSGYEVVDEKTVGSSLLRRTCISLNADLPLRWRFYFYKFENTWKLVDLRVDDGLVELFEEAGRARK